MLDINRQSRGNAVYEYVSMTLIYLSLGYKDAMLLTLYQFVLEINTKNQENNIKLN